MAQNPFPAELPKTRAPCQRCGGLGSIAIARPPYTRPCTDCREHRLDGLARRFFATMQDATMGDRPHADAAHLAFDRLPPDVQRGWRAVAATADRTW